MADTMKLGLPLVAPAQAQKHVTVNEALARLDGMVHLTLLSVGALTPPSLPNEGDVHAVGAPASDDWAGQDDTLAIYQNGGWAFVTPKVGWRAFSVSDGTTCAFDGASWIAGAGALSPSGAAFVHRSLEMDHSVSAGASSAVVGAIPANAIVYGITGRVLSDIGGATGFEIGVASSTDRYGSGIGTGLGAWARGLTSAPVTYYGATDLTLTALGGNFDGTGSFRLVVHYAELTLPRA